MSDTKKFSSPAGNIERRCYITGKTTAVGKYYFGSEDRLTLDLNQEAFAYFIIRAGKDQEHQKIMSAIDSLSTELQAVKESAGVLSDFNSDEAIELAFKANNLIDDINRLLTKKCESGVRLLRQMRQEYQQTGQLQ